MDVDTGYIRKVDSQLEISRIKSLLREREMLIPRESEEQVINMTRQQRRAWARKQAKIQERGT